jgi:tetratricopeptide (TPR) repeat protein
MAATLAALLAAACRERDPEPPPPPPPPLTVEWSGCSAVLKGPICEVAEGSELQIWVKTPDGATLTVAIDGQPKHASGAPVQGGLRIPVAIPRDAGALAVTVAQGGAQATFRLPLSPRVIEPALEEAEALRREGKLDEAEQRLTAPLHDPRAAVRARAVGKLARIERSRGRSERAIELFQEALRLDRTEGRISDEFLDRFALAYTLLFHGRRSAEAHRVLTELRSLEPEHPAGRVMAPYYLGLIASETSDFHTALRLFRESAEGAARLGLEAHRADVLQPLAGALTRLGRYGEAEALLHEAQENLPEGAPPCQKAHLFNNRGWAALQAAVGEGLHPTPPDPKPLFLEALRIYREACPEPADLQNTLTNLALAELERRDEATHYLDEARRAAPRPDVRVSVWWVIIEARLALRSERFEDALRRYDQLSAIGRSALLPETSFEAAVGRAQALDALGRVKEAWEAYAQAEVLLEEQTRTVPLGEGREAFLTMHERTARLWMDFLLRKARRAAQGTKERARALDEVAAVARRSRSRILRALQWLDRRAAQSPAERARWEESLEAYRREREALDQKASGDWALSKSRLAEAITDRQAEHARLRGALDRLLASLGPPLGEGGERRELPAPDEGELLLVYHPSLVGWVGLAVSARGVLKEHPLGALDLGAPPAKLAEALLSPFRDAIAGAGRVRFAAYGPLDRVDLHALPWEGKPLLERVPVTYGLDLAPRPREPGAPGARPTAVLVADPREDLPAARREAGAVKSSLEGSGWKVVLLEGREATHRAVREVVELPGAELLHYAGHGLFGGRDGWESGLPLAENGWLTVADVLALRRVPARVILSGCETARTAGEVEVSSLGGLGVAQAFTAAGAESVVAATRPVGDLLADRMMRRLYGADPSGFLLDPAASLRAAQIALANEDDGADWSSFRVLRR